MASCIPCLLQTNNSFSLRLSEPKRTLLWGQIRQIAEAKTEIGLPSTDRALYSHKARFFNQSERALYRNFIIIKNTKIPQNNSDACNKSYVDNNITNVNNKITD